MRKFARSMLCTLALAAMPYATFAAQHDVSLASIARSTGLTYTWLGVERAVSLIRNGLVIVVRPGDDEYEVNDRVEVTAQVPHYTAGDIYVSPSLARRIEALARVASARAAAAARANAGPSVAPPPSPPLTGSIALEASPLAGSEAIVVNGQAPQAAPITITLFATLSSDIPTVIVSRHDVQADVNGRFQAIIPIASDYFRGSILKVLATSVPGVSSASAQLIVGPPNAGVSVPVEKASHAIW